MRPPTRRPSILRHTASAAAAARALVMLAAQLLLLRLRALAPLLPFGPVMLVLTLEAGRFCELLPQLSAALLLPGVLKVLRVLLDTSRPSSYTQLPKPSCASPAAGTDRVIPLLLLLPALMPRLRAVPTEKEPQVEACRHGDTNTTA